jgi:hypothetical protein
MRRRSRYYGSDWCDPFRSVDDALKTLSSAVYMFMALFFVEVALAEAARDETDGAVGVTEFLFLIALSGIAQTVVGAQVSAVLNRAGVCPSRHAKGDTEEQAGVTWWVQPLVVLRPTGPIVLVTTSLYELSGTLWPAEGEGECVFERPTRGVLIRAFLFVWLVWRRLRQP